MPSCSRASSPRSPAIDEVAAAEPDRDRRCRVCRWSTTTEFTVRLKAPTIDFTLRLGVLAVLPAAGGRVQGHGGVRAASDRQRPVPAGRQSGDRPGSTTSSIDLVPNPGYHGNRMPQEQGPAVRLLRQPRHRLRRPAVRQSRCAGHHSAQRAARSTATTSAIARVTAPAAARTRRWTRRCGCRTSAARRAGCAGWRCPRRSTGQQICRPDLQRKPHPGPRFHRRARCPDSTPHLPGNDALNFDPDRARRLWAQADAISPWSGQYAIAYNADGGHQEWVDAVANSIKNTLGIDAVGAPQPTFAGFRTQITNRTHRHRVPGRLAGRLPVDAGVPRTVVRHRRGLQRRRLLQPASSTPRWPPPRPRPHSPESYALTNDAQRILLRRHARRAAVVLHRGRGAFGGGQPACTGHLERAARLREHREGLRWGWYIAATDRGHDSGVPRCDAADLRHGLPAAR